MSIDSYLLLNEQKAQLTINAGNQSKIEEVDLSDFFLSLSEVSFFETGLLPLDGSGVLSIRKSFDRMQVVFQHKPEIYRVIWGQNEGDQEAIHYDLAMPYRIVIGDFLKNEFYGARHFYSISPITNKNQILFHVNLPNLNCKGYGQTHAGGSVGVGWICLYHNQPSISQLDIGQKISHLLERSGGTEAYNDSNMSETDGPRFYHECYTKEFCEYKGTYNVENDEEFQSYSYLWNPEDWEQKSETEGFQWTLDPSIWLPVMVEGLDSQGKHHENGEHLTIGSAMDGKYKAYYTDSEPIKSYQSFSRSDLENPSGKDVLSNIKKAFTNTKHKEIKPLNQNDPIVPIAGPSFCCYVCKGFYGYDHCVETDDGHVCTTCSEVEYETCASCLNIKHFSKLYYSQYEEVFNFHCTDCANVSYCTKCNAFFTVLEGNHSCVSSLTSYADPAKSV